jgi:hypothetical protein
MMHVEKPIADGHFLLEKYPGKGGWTYAQIPNVPPDRNNPFGWVKVKGSIDKFPLKQYKLMPMGQGKLFLPVKASIRKKIGKEAGDEVRIRLFYDNDPFQIPDEILACFQNEPTSLFTTFLSLPDSHKKAYLDWIYEAKKDETRARRIAGMMDRLSKG